MVLRHWQRRKYRPQKYDNSANFRGGTNKPKCEDFQMLYFSLEYDTTAVNEKKHSESRNNLVLLVDIWATWQLVQLYRFFFFPSSSSTTVRWGPWFPIQASSIPDCLWPSVFSSHYKYNPVQPRYSIFYVVLFFPCSFYCSCCNLFWHSLVLHSFNITTPSQSEGFYKLYNICL
jgi:hypothetical protein